MIRFTPDTWRDALWRPLAMGAPDAGVYIETMAPDLRFAILILLTVASALVALRRGTRARSTWLLLAFVWISFVPWLLTSGNGRYFIPVLLVVGPLCIALVRHLGLAGRWQLTLAGLIVAVQAAVVIESDPRASWGLVPWGKTYFDLALTPAQQQQPATYVVITGISYSLLAPQFDHRSRWVSISTIPGNADTSPDAVRAQRFLAEGVAAGLPLRLLVPTVPKYVDDELQPEADLRVEIDRLLGRFRIALQDGARCELLTSRAMTGRVTKRQAEPRKALLKKVGFWVCPLQFPVNPQQAPRVAPAESVEGRQRADAAFAKLERLCPRIFPAGLGAVSVRIGDGYMRGYSESDIKSYVMDDGLVFFRYWRALNANEVGRIDDVLAPGFAMDCDQVHGRSGLPWERKL